MFKIFNPFLLLSAFACLSRAIASETPLHLVPAYPNLTFDDPATALAITVDGKARRMVVATGPGVWTEGSGKYLEETEKYCELS